MDGRSAAVYPSRSLSLSARVWSALLPYEGWVAYTDRSDPDDHNPAPWWAYPLAWLFRLNDWLFKPAPYKATPPVVCNCDYCRGVPGAVFEP